MFKRRTKRPVGTTAIRRLFHGVSIEATGGNICPAASALAGKRFLAHEAPLFPLEGCDRRAACRCRYLHFEDRRNDIRRESDHGLPVRSHLQDMRTGNGRRVTDS